MINKYRKKPVVIQAVRYQGAGEFGNLDEVLDFTGKHPSWNDYFNDFEHYRRHVLNDREVFKIITLEGTMEAVPGDWIIKGVAGECYPCKPEIFEATYDPA